MPNHPAFLSYIAFAATFVHPGLAQVWEAVPLVTAQVRSTGVAGGEGCQWPQCIAVEPKQGKRVLLGTDVGGIYRSEDGGIHWEPSNTGLNARGASAFAFDPANPDRVLMVAGNSIEKPFHGIYLSTDGGVSWSNTLPYDNLGYRDFREQVAFDHTSLDPKTNLTRKAYWSAAKTKTRGPGFFKTEDGGTKWQEIAGIGELLGSCILKTHPTRGWIYAAGPKGLFRSQDEGLQFTKCFDEPVTGLDVVVTQPDRVFVSTASGVYVSEDAGNSFTRIASTKFPKKARSGVARLRVSPADPKRMVLENDEGDWNLKRYVSHDGGIQWDACGFNTNASFIPNNNRQLVVAWHPTDANVAWSIGGDFITRSTDGGKTWNWSNSGYTGLMVGHSFQFNATDPNLVFVPSQDYDGSVSPDAGNTWKYVGVSGEHWGGYTYGGYAFSMEHVVGGSRIGWGGSAELRANKAGKVIKTGITLKGIPVGAGDPLDPAVAFIYNHRTGDGGKTWKPMENCDGVLTYDAFDPSRLYGAKKGSVVVSVDHGLTWNVICKLPEGSVADLAVDHQNGGLYIASSSDKLFTYNLETQVMEDISARLPQDQFGNRGASSVAVDPVNPSIIYVVRPGNIYAKDTAVVRSTDAGRTWTSLNRSLRLGTGLNGPDGGREAMWVRVHPGSRYAYVATNCFGLWRIGAPQ